MSEYEVEYCPWCSGDISTTCVQQGHNWIQAKKCDECETVFRVEVPNRKTRVEWTTAH